MTSGSMRIRIFVVAALLLLGVLALVVLWPTDEDVAEPYNRPRPTSLQVPAQPATTGQAEAAVEHPPANETPPVPATLPNAGTVRLTVRMVDTAGQGIPLVGFAYCIVPLTQGAVRPDDSAVQPAQSDMKGEWTTSAAPLGMLWIRALDPVWQCVEVGGRGHAGARSRDLPELAAVRLTTEPEQLVVLQLSRSGSCTIVVEYADGTPFEGVINVGWFRDAERNERLGPFRPVPHTPGMTINVSQSTWLRIAAHSERGGYQEHTSVDPSREQVELGHLRIVIPEDPSRLEAATLILDHRQFLEGQQLLAALVTPSGSFTGRKADLVGPGETRLSFIRARAAITIMAIGKTAVWTAGPLILEPGEVRRVKVEPAMTAELTVLVVDERQQPLAGAVVSAEEVGRADWAGLGIYEYEPEFEPQRPQASNLAYFKGRMTRARTDDDGTARFAATWPGPRKLRIDAIGYESVVFEAHLVPGKSTHAGTFSLQPATGVVTVRALLPQGMRGGEYRVWLYVRGASLLQGATPLQADGTIVLERIPSERIQVFINPHPRGGPGWFRWVDLAPGERADVTIDLTRNPGLQED